MSIARAVAAAGRAAARADGTKVDYYRGDVLLVEGLSAPKGSSTRQVLTADGSYITVRSQDFLIMAEDLVQDGVPTVPQRGDKIVETTSAGDREYELLEGDGRPSWRWSDRWHTRLRVHTKEITNPE